MTEWLAVNETWLWPLGGLSLVTFLGTLIVVPLLVVRMRSDYFVRSAPPSDSWSGQHPALRFSLLVLKNLLGGACILVGLGMLFLPGQGILTILIGLTLLNFPGKRRLELLIVRQRAVLAGINWMRAKANQPLLQVPEA